MWSRILACTGILIFKDSDEESDPGIYQNLDILLITFYFKGFVNFRSRKLVELP